MLSDKNTTRSSIEIVAPANSMIHINPALIEIGKQRLSSEFDVDVRFGASVFQNNLFASSTPQNRAHDIHEAILNKSNIAIIAAYGGYNTNDILPFLDYDLIASSQIPFVGYSDFTVLLNAVYAKTSRRSILGPAFISLCDPNMFQSALLSLKSALDREKNIVLKAPETSACDDWYLKDQFGPREIYSHSGWIPYHRGHVTAKVVGGNLESFIALLGTPFFPSCEGHILLVEANINEPPGRFVRDFIHLKQAGILEEIKGVIIGQFAPDSPLSGEGFKDILDFVFDSPQYPIVYNVNVSHVDPILSVPIGGEVLLRVDDTPEILIL
jgi:muramoyltetrapeptide carboxypeptidase